MIHLALQHFSVQTSIASNKSIEVHRLNAHFIYCALQILQIIYRKNCDKITEMFFILLSRLSNLTLGLSITILNESSENKYSVRSSALSRKYIF